MKKITSILMLFLMCFGMAVQAAPTDLPELTVEGQSPKLYTIKNVRRAKFASYAGDNQAIKQVTANEISSASLFYFTGSITGDVATVKIHNAAAPGKKCAEANSWTAEGRDWYIASKTATGLSISKTQNFDGHNSWNDYNGSGKEVGYWDATDDGSIWEITPFETSVATENQFSNHFVYTVVSPRGWMMYKEGCNDVVSTKKYPELVTGADVPACQWAIFKSGRGNFYMYNLGAKKFMGLSKENNSSIPFVDSPVSDKLKFKPSTNAKKKAEFPLMPYYDGVTALNHTDIYGNGLIAWTGGINDTNDEGNIHKFTFAGELSDEDYQLISQKVTTFEEKYQLEELKNYYLAIAGCVGGLSVADSKELQTKQTLDEANKFIESCTKIVFNADKFYRLKNYCRNLSRDNGVHPYEGGFMGDNLKDGVGVNCHSVSMADAACIWKFEAVENNTYKVKNLNSGKYIGKTQGGNSKLVNQAIFEDAGIYTLESVGNSQYNLVCSNGLDGHKKLHVSGLDKVKNGVMNYDAGANSASAWYLVEATELEVDMNAAGEASWSSLYLPFDVTLPAEGLEAFTGKLKGNTLSMTKVTEVPANNGVILKGTNNKYTLNIAPAKALEGENALKGTNVKKEITDKTQFYILGNTAEHGVGLYNPNTTTLKANKAYVEAAVAAQVLKFDFNGEATGVEGVEVETENAKAVYYDLSGRRVANPAHGLYIKNGKKVYVK